MTAPDPADGAVDLDDFARGPGEVMRAGIGAMTQALEWKRERDAARAALAGAQAREQRVRVILAGAIVNPYRQPGTVALVDAEGLLAALDES